MERLLLHDKHIALQNLLSEKEILLEKIFHRCVNFSFLWKCSMETTPCYKCKYSNAIFVSPKCYQIFFIFFWDFFFAIVCAVQAQELGLCLTGKTCRRWRQCHSSTWGPKCWPKYGISLRSVVLVLPREDHRKNLLSFYDIFSNKLLLEKSLLQQWGEILLHKTKKLSSSHLDPPIRHQFVFVFSTQWRREIQLSDENLTTFSVRTQKVQKIPAFG